MIYLNVPGGGKEMYTTEKYSNDIRIDEYIDKYVNVAEFLEYCKA